MQTMELTETHNTLQQNFDGLADKVRWNKVYSYLSSDEQFRGTIRKYLEMSEDDRYNYFSNRKRNTDDINHVTKASQKKVFDFETL